MDVSTLVLGNFNPQ